jgi:hypothetical protein
LVIKLTILVWYKLNAKPACRTSYGLNQLVEHHREEPKMAKKKTATGKPAAGKNGTTKAQSIRDTAKELGKKARPRDIVATLAAKGIKVAPAQVSTVLKAAGLRRGRRRRKVEVAVGPKKHSGNGRGLNINELVQVKKLAEQLGGTDRLKELVGSLERLL